MASTINKTSLSRILRRQQVEDRTGVSRSTLYKWMREGRFPAPLRLGPRAVGWDAADIDRWIEQRRDPEPLEHFARRARQGGRA